MRSVIWWIRRDLRLQDNLALRKAIGTGLPVIPVFIRDPALIKPKEHKRQAFLFSSLKELDRSLKSHSSFLMVCEGNPENVLTQLFKDFGCEKVFAEEDYTPLAISRDNKIKGLLPLVMTGGLTAHHPSYVLKMDGAPYTKFTPFSKTWKNLPLPCGELWDPPDKMNTPSGLPTKPLPGYQNFPGFPPGEKEAQSRLEDFIQNKASEYHSNRDRMDIDGTSSLSPYIHMGTISVCRILLSLEKLKSDISENGDLLGIETWKNELVWREFYQSILYHFPFVQKISFNPKFRSIEWSNSPEALIAWKDRSTGFPIVDAAMNQLLKSAWMHNRARMIVASFLTKDLLINWQEGEKWFMDQLIDGDLASNNGGWQWTAGVGTDAAPFFRIFNPILQSKKFDPQGDYIRKWVPALTDIPTEYIHEPWLMPDLIQSKYGCKIGKDYPFPIIDRKNSRERTLRAYNLSKNYFLSKKDLRRKV